MKFFSRRDVIDMVDQLEKSGKIDNRDAWDTALNRLPVYDKADAIEDPIERDTVFARKETLEFRPAKQGLLMQLLHRAFGWDTAAAA